MTQIIFEIQKNLFMHLDFDEAKVTKDTHIHFPPPLSPSMKWYYRENDNLIDLNEKVPL